MLTTSSDIAVIAAYLWSDVFVTVENFVLDKFSMYAYYGTEFWETDRSSTSGGFVAAGACSAEEDLCQEGQGSSMLKACEPSA